jgi:hypothetical protein
MVQLLQEWEEGLQFHSESLFSAILLIEMNTTADLLNNELELAEFGHGQGPTLWPMAAEDVTGYDQAPSTWFAPELINVRIQLILVAR